MKRIIYILSLLLCISFIGACSNDDEKEIYKIIENEKLTFYKNNESIQHFERNIHWVEKENMKKALFFSLGEMKGMAHDLPNEFYDLPIPDEGLEVLISGRALKSENTYSIVPEDIGVEFYITSISVTPSK